MVLRKLLKGYVERYAAKLFGRVFWPPTSAVVLAEGDHEDILALNVNGQYELPGGLLNFGEDMRDAARREAREETGFEVEIGDLLDIHVSDVNGSIIYFFEGEIVGGEKDGSWEGDPEFIDKEEISEKVWRLEHSHVHEYLFPEE